MPFSAQDNPSSGDEAVGDDPTPAVVAWRDRALERSLGDVRARSVERMERLVDAARELAAETGSASFTVQQVVGRAGLSLKSFYRYFGGKDDLLLALIEQDCALGALFLAEMIDRHRSPVDRIEAWVTGLFRLMAAGAESYVAVLGREHHRLSEARPDELDAAVAPFVDLLVAELAAARTAGVVHRDDPRREAELVFDLVLARIHRLVLHARPPDGARNGTDRAAVVAAGPAVVARRPDPARVAEVDRVARDLWRFCWSGLRADGSP